jgi:hypothetical protein
MKIRYPSFSASILEADLRRRKTAWYALGAIFVYPNYDLELAECRSLSENDVMNNWFSDQSAQRIAKILFDLGYDNNEIDHMVRCEVAPAIWSRIEFDLQFTDYDLIDENWFAEIVYQHYCRPFRNIRYILNLPFMRLKEAQKNINLLLDTISKLPKQTLDQ